MDSLHLSQLNKEGFAVCNQETILIQLVLTLCETTASSCKTHSCPLSWLDQFETFAL